MFSTQNPCLTLSPRPHHKPHMRCVTRAHAPTNCFHAGCCCHFFGTHFRNEAGRWPHTSRWRVTSCARRQKKRNNTRNSKAHERDAKNQLKQRNAREPHHCGRLATTCHEFGKVLSSLVHYAKTLSTIAENVHTEYFLSGGATTMRSWMAPTPEVPSSCAQ